MFALVIVCALSTPCDEAHSRQTLRVPGTFASPVTCFLHGTTFLAELSIGELAADEYPRVICSRAK